MLILTDSLENVKKALKESVNIKIESSTQNFMSFYYRNKNILVFNIRNNAISTLAHAINNGCHDFIIQFFTVNDATTKNAIVLLKQLSKLEYCKNVNATALNLKETLDELYPTQNTPSKSNDSDSDSQLTENDFEDGCVWVCAPEAGQNTQIMPDPVLLPKANQTSLFSGFFNQKKDQQSRTNTGNRKTLIVSS